MSPSVDENPGLGADAVDGAASVGRASTTDTATTDAAVPDTATLRVVSGNPTQAELAVISAVIDGMAREIEGAQRIPAGGGQSAWQKSARPGRTPIVPGRRAWRGFSG